jgi:hypothetical protein
MGQEMECVMRRAGQALTGTAYLETNYILFRGAERLKISFPELHGVTASGGVLTLEWDAGRAEFELGKAAEKWADKIRNPRTRADKLGVRSDSRYRLVGQFETEFESELRARGAGPAAGRAKADLVFFAADRTLDLKDVPRLAAQMKTDGGLWVVYPKGVAAIREGEVLAAGRAAGLKDTKVASFSATHTALRFVVPLSDR